MAFRRVHTGDADPQGHADLVLGFGDALAIVVAQVQVAEEAGFKFDFRVEKGAQVQHG